MPQAAIPIVAGLATGAASGLFGGGNERAIQGATRRRDLIMPFTAGGLRADVNNGRVTVGQTGGGLRLPPGTRVQGGRVVRDVQVPGAAGGGFSVIGSRRLPTAGPPTTQTLDIGPVSDFQTAGTAPRQGLVDRLSGVFGDQAGQLEELLPMIAPGFSAFREAGLNEIEDRARRSIGNLRQNLADRRISGSSFGQNALAREEAEFARAEADFTSKAFLQELDNTVRLISNITNARASEVETLLDELDFRAGIGLQLASGVQSELGAGARLKARLAFDSAQNAGAFFEPAVSGIGNAVGDAVTNAFNSASSGGTGNPGLTADLFGF